jgi:regulator of protease activity HflC (stomatin/prohibitin superfamily)
VLADAVVYYKIFDPVLAAYNVQRLGLAISNLVKTQVRSEIGKLELDATFSAREALGEALLSSLDIATDPWGVRVTRVEIQEITPNKDILRSMEQVMAAERDKRANVLRSEGERLSLANAAAANADAAIQAAKADKTATILAAEAAATAQALRAEAEAGALVATATAQAEATRLGGEATQVALVSIAEGLKGDVSAFHST